ncbi:trehalose-6-phosphate hydrolase [Liquorilactobacillus aquaticus DSM 21051]|uniref:Alpha,alpha-phosphotrehalase n=1 Tax=Liquorilactobacillus aquaticus DSM 21051 TaxID=1423725 RepID=A0A0R2CUA9_9LACO|nr:alpha,alpha-phosphotrehalase [Liquorilactobacillus aquaticus]KRM95377.1 trehalose-6-phosphate hydrolase [Liquorilactobacillus aquaticus DSM 21051]
MINLGNKVIYQIYPKSFYDSNNDGIGDLRGIIDKIDYISKLNIDMIWFNPFFVSPQNDNGYDIADYYNIDPKFGTMSDFEDLVAALKKIDVGVMLDMVLNHCSTEHEWFRRALAGEKKYQKYFYLRPAKEDGSLPTNWQSKFGGPAWEKFGQTDLYYLHLYDKSQADLDWHNPDVRKEAAAVVNFWRSKGVQGFRFDVINVTGKSEQMVDSVDPIQEKALYTDTPVVHEYLKELNRSSFGKDPNSITVGEMSSTSIGNCIEYSHPEKDELSMVFTFHHLKVDYKDGEKWSKTPFDFKKLKRLFIDWQTQMDRGGGWNALFWNNHDQPWALNRFGDPIKYREKSAELLATAIHLMRGTPYIYMGEELGMIDPNYQSIHDYVDIESLNAYRELLEKGVSSQTAFKLVQTKSRDNSRVPMHWDNTLNAGFSQSRPWLRPTGQDIINVKDELEHGEIFNYYQKLILLRKSEKLISEGHFSSLLEDNPQVFAYERYLLDDLQEKRMLVINNFYGKPTTVTLPKQYQDKAVKTLISNYNLDITKLDKEIVLRPYEALAVKFN